MGQETDCLDVDLERRRISVLTALALLGGATVTISGCGGGGSPSAPTPTPTPTPSPSCPTGGRCGVVSADPRHSAVITAAQLTAGGALVLDIQGTAEHNHTVELSSDEVVSIRDGRRVQKSSSNTSNHSHSVTFN
jgi:hypothetical protein